MEEVSFKIKTEVFEGPLELLLNLIEKRKLLINDIALSKVADDFIEHIKGYNQFPVEMTANFILVASTLLLIKSKSLLPSMQLTQEEEGSIEDLEKRLVIYKRIKEAGEKIGKSFGKNIIFQREPSREMKVVFSPSDEIETLKMLEAMRRVLNSLPKKEVLPKTIVKKIISLEDMIDRLSDRIKSDLKMNFSEFAKSQGKTVAHGARHSATREEKVNIIVSFLAMLELIKRGMINANQEDFLDDILIETENLGIPNYN